MILAPWTTDPSTSAAWTVSGINGVDYIGAYGEWAGNFSIGYSGARVTQVYAEVSYNLKAPYACAGPGIVVVLNQ